MDATLSLSATIYDDVAAQEAKEKTEKAVEKPREGAKGRVCVIGEGKRNDNAKVVAVKMASGEKIRITESYVNCKMTLGKENSVIELMPMSMSKYDVIVGMDWLNQFHAQIDCDQRTVRICRPNGEFMLIQCDSDKNVGPFVCVGSLHASGLLVGPGAEYP
ncbi:hypothetical protein L1987_45858 [Smallanthus sonchifolius]|uniref:Uncharacterized protein n=1 Tax=Smallanthus sonchifolius TaxID=185202 RepID=A0ACB9FZ44_9ASTR|nr:hypothetical protein L1987_45858 [Smallanthus sonchifolius]